MSPVGDAEIVAKGKVANYSPETTVDLLAAWDKSEKTKADVESLAILFGKSARSIVAKLSREKVYVKATYVTKAGEKPVSKEAHVVTIAGIIGIGSDKLDSLEKANKTVLQVIETALVDSNPIAKDTDEDTLNKTDLIILIRELLDSDDKALDSLKYANMAALTIIKNALQGSDSEF